MNLEKQIQLAVRGEPSQEYSLGLRYYLGDDVIKDYKTALLLFEKSANHGYQKAQFHLGLIYYYGWGVDKDVRQAGLWFSKAAQSGDVWGQFYNALINRLPELRDR